MTQDDLPMDDRALAGEYALGLMTRAEAAAFAARLADEPALRDLVARWETELAELADEIEPVTPPRRLGRRIEARLFGAPPWPRWLLPGLVGVLGATLALALVVLPALQGARPPVDPVYHADLATTEGTMVLAAGYDATTGELYVEPLRGPEPGMAHELWLIAGENPPVSLGLVPGVRPLRLPIAPGLAAALAGGVLAVSVEPPTGSPTGAPTGPVIATGEVTTL